MALREKQEYAMSNQIEWILIWTTRINCIQYLNVNILSKYVNINLPIIVNFNLISSEIHKFILYSVPRRNTMQVVLYDKYGSSKKFSLCFKM